MDDEDDYNLVLFDETNPFSSSNPPIQPQGSSDLSQVDFGENAVFDKDNLFLPINGHRPDNILPSGGGFPLHGSSGSHQEEYPSFDCVSPPTISNISSEHPETATDITQDTGSADPFAVMSEADLAWAVSEFDAAINNTLDPFELEGT
jgi:hypothetical protein